MRSSSRVRTGRRACGRSEYSVAPHKIGDGTRVGANTCFHCAAARSGSAPARRSATSAVLTADGGKIELAERCFISYGAVLHASERIVIEERVALGDRVTLADPA